jgi:hypothetical protein
MVRLQVWSGGRPFTVDGHAVESGWEGYYFPGMVVRIAPTGKSDTAWQWRVNGQPVTDQDVTLRIDRDTVVDAYQR